MGVSWRLRRSRTLRGLPGIYALANNEIAVIGEGESFSKREIEEVLGVEVIDEVRIRETSLLGIFCAMNSYCAVFPRGTSRKEMSWAKSAGIETIILEEVMTAVGNLILMNDNGAIVHPGLSESSLNALKETGMRVKRGTIGGLKTVGSAAIANNKGVLANPNCTEEEAELVEEVLGVPLEVGTVNSGIPYPKVGILLNDKGAIVGYETTGPELGRIQLALFQR